MSNDYNKAFNVVYSQVAPDVNDLYQYYRERKGLEDEKDVERQLEILTNKKYISITYISNLSLLVDYLVRGMEIRYQSELQAYQNRIRSFLADYS